MKFSPFKFLVPKAAVATLAFALIYVAGLAPAFAHEGFDGREAGSFNETPDELKNVGIEEHLGEPVDMNLTFRDEMGAVVPLSAFTAKKKPVLLTLAYYECPGLCNYHLNGLNDAFKELKEPLGKEFEVVVVSIQPKETPDLATKKKEAYLKAYGRPEGASGWHFLTGDQANITKLAQQVGFKYHWDEKEKQFAHTSAAYALTPDGLISRYFYGIIFDAKVLRLSMIEASNGSIGTIVDKLTLFCFHFDPKASKYTVAAFNVMRAGGGLTVLLMACFLFPFWLRSRNRKGEGKSGRSESNDPKVQLDVQGEA
jgi:protein SCO1/2